MEVIIGIIVIAAFFYGGYLFKVSLEGPKCPSCGERYSSKYWDEDKEQKLFHCELCGECYGPEEWYARWFW